MTKLSKPAPEDIARHYANAHKRVVELARSLSDEQLATPVPATPGWTVHDVIAHLAALPTDALAGRLSGIPTDEFTSEQIDARKSATVDQLVEEWRSNVDQMLELAQAGLVSPNLAVDAVTHEQDIRGAIGADRVGDTEAVRFSLNLYAFGVSRRLREAQLPLRVVALDSDFDLVAGEGDPEATVRAEEFELFRAFSGRRGRHAILAMQWDGDAGPFLSYLNVFGRVPEGDIRD